MPSPPLPQDAIRVLVVDDSAFMRKVITDMVDMEDDLQVVGTARNGQEAVDAARRLQPDVITMDVEMPGMSGLEALKALRHERLGKVLMLSGHTTDGAQVTLEALELGAYDFVPKPSVGVALDIDKIREILLEKIRMAPSIKLQPVAPKPAATVPEPPTGRPAPPPRDLVRDTRLRHIVVIGTSTGGPRALKTLLPALHADAPAAYLVVQHMPKGFTASLASRLDRDCDIEVVEGKSGLPLVPGRAIVAPGGQHMTVNPDNTVNTFVGTPRNGVMPAVDVTLESAVERFGKEVLGVILTGMGRDGTAGCRRVRKAQGTVLAEDDSTAVVYGMPRSVVEEGLANEVLPLHEMARRIGQLTTHPRPNGGIPVAR